MSTAVATAPVNRYSAAMPRKPISPSELAKKMAVAEEIMREDDAILAALAGSEPGAETQMQVTRDVMRRRRHALRRLSRS